MNPSNFFGGSYSFQKSRPGRRDVREDPYFCFSNDDESKLPLPISIPAASEIGAAIGK
jgi:hypothetical protein